jgi:hypothetical protein
MDKLQGAVKRSSAMKLSPERQGGKFFPPLQSQKTPTVCNSNSKKKKVMF